MKKRFVQYGAGSIGRSFTGALFARAGYEVVFIDVNPTLIDTLNRDRRYRVKIEDTPPGEFWVEGIRAVDGRDVEAAAAEIAQADIMATALGARILPKVCPVIARGLQQRLSAGMPPLDIIIAENIRNGAGVLATGLCESLPPDFPIHEYVGLIETSIGKMAPIMPEEVAQREPTLVYAEAYNTLILDAVAFKNPIPEVPGLAPKQNIAAYVDRKLFIHNLSHAALAYLGHLIRPEIHYVWEAASNPELRHLAQSAMNESAQALISRYPEEFTAQDLNEHIADLLRRFCNCALGDTIFRLGRDLPRKLAKDDRVIGALRFDAEMGVAAPVTTRVAAAALSFTATDEEGRPFPADAEFHRKLQSNGPESVLQEICGLNPQHPTEARIMADIVQLYRHQL